MKIGPRKPSLKKSFKAKTTGKVKRQVKKSVNPLYGNNGMGWVNDPKKAAYNKVYNKTSFSVTDGLKEGNSSNKNIDDDVTTTCLGCGCLAFIIIILAIIIFVIL
ncbi:hypothetical protein OQL12_000930 [Clostridium perfringens]|uniref:hypothetical protein n=1 Tax=Clostridium TaxID=1485 RepID=UPI001A3176FA|nr:MULTISPECIES: hypothetical protein [Clostridium]MDU2094218.1 hypothetical protein [Clostridium perfringens]MDU2227305.1 hypothetical protein [Clostridium perfringens]MDU4145811.1 hypothetical protein [Clostridium sp.]UBK33507.1 hypothetical protein KLF25_08230 [Clostridium perfringens]UBL02280.1 hypothetical protein KLF24_07780 [Clostridium perfringens]